MQSSLEKKINKNKNKNKERQRERENKRKHAYSRLWNGSLIDTPIINCQKHFFLYYPIKFGKLNCKAFSESYASRSV